MGSRWLGLVAAGILGVATSTPIQAAFPDRAITAVIPFTVGGLSDVTGRLIATYLSRKLGQTILVQNKPGAGGNIGIQFALHAKPDGYTILLCSLAMTTNPALYGHLGWATTEVQPVALVGFIPNVVAVNNKRFPKGGLMDLVAELRAKPGQYNFPSSDSTINESLFRLVTGTEIVPYPSADDGATSLLSGETDVATTGCQVIIPLLSSGKIRVLAVTGPRRLQAVPDVPTTSEAGLPGYQPINYFGVYVPATTPSEIVVALNKAVNEAASDPDLVERMTTLGATTHQSTVPEPRHSFEPIWQPGRTLSQRRNPADRLIRAHQDATAPRRGLADQ